LTVSGTLHVVATPIGNLADASPRALAVLRAAALVACEDTRVSRTLLARHGIAARTLALHAHNEREAAGRVLAALAAGGDVALVSDAGTPGVSDPGAFVVAEAHRAGVRVVPVPGPNAAVAALSAAGFPARSFFFAGFLPPAGQARAAAIETLAAPWPCVLYEAPHRVARTVAQLAERFGPRREAVIARELTKKFEEVVRLPLGEAPAWLAAKAERRRGEFVLVLAPLARTPASEALAEGTRVLALLRPLLPPAEAARIAARITGAPKSVLYRLAIAERAEAACRR